MDLKKKIISFLTDKKVNGLSYTSMHSKYAIANTCYLSTKNISIFSYDFVY